jgi:hypothetical protein
VSGQSYDEYIQDHILDPLGMAHSTAQLPRPAELRALASVGYTFEDGAFQAFPEWIPQWVELPAGLVQASATDMARFMIAHLQGGRYSDVDIPEARILEEATAQQMHTTLYSPDRRILGNAYGFFDFSDNGQRTLGHGGESTPMFTELLLLPDQNLGVFVTYNSMGGAELTGQHLGFQRAFFDHYYPAPPLEPIQPPADFEERAGRFAGSYRLTQMSYTTLEKYMGLFGAGVLEVSASGDGALRLTTPWGEMRLVEVEPLYFRQADGPFGVAFRENDQGRITHLFADLTPMYSFEKLNWYETPGFHMALLIGSELIFLSVLAVAVIGAVRNRRLGAERKPVPSGARMAQWIVLGISVLNLLFVAGMFVWGNPKPMVGVSAGFRSVLGLGVVAAVLTLGAVVCAVLAWKNRYWGMAGRGYYTLVTVAAVAFVWFLNYWNLLGWRF